MTAPGRPRARGFFVTGTDTGVGKTRIACGLIRGLQDLGYVTTGMKPVIAGTTSDDLVNIAAVSNISPKLNDEHLSPYQLALPQSPHIAALSEGTCIEIKHIIANFNLISSECQQIVVEGTGGWLCPINHHQTMADVATAMKLPVVLVVGLRLGCLNHALLTARAIRADGLTLAGWIANSIDPTFSAAAANIDALRERLAMEPVAVVQYRPAPRAGDLSLSEAARALTRC